MSRTLYRWLLWMHPAAFRRQYADEMLWIFDEASATQGARGLLGDAAVSLTRQWLLRSGSWKIAAALAGALIQVTIGGLGHVLFGPLSRGGPLAPVHAAEPIELQSLIRIIIWTVSGIGVTVILLATWVKKFSARRIRAVHL